MLKYVIITITIFLLGHSAMFFTIYYFQHRFLYKATKMQHEKTTTKRPNQLEENKIEQLIHKGWSLISWKDRYGRGIIAAIAPNEYQAYKLQDILTGADNESLNLADFCNEQNLPVVSSENLKTAMLLLNWKISRFINTPNIINKIISDYEYITENDWNKR